MDIKRCIFIRIHEFVQILLINSNSLAIIWIINKKKEKLVYIFIYIYNYENKARNIKIVTFLIVNFLI